MAPQPRHLAERWSARIAVLMEGAFVERVRRGAPELLDRLLVNAPLIDSEAGRADGVFEIRPAQHQGTTNHGLIVDEQCGNPVCKLTGGNSERTAVVRDQPDGTVTVHLGHDGAKGS